MNRGYPHFTNLLFAIPITGRMVPTEIMFAFHAMAMPMNYNNIVQSVKGMAVDQAREHFGNLAIQNNCKYIFFWDEDVACPPQTIPELIYKMEQHPEIAVCGGVYCLKRDPAEPLIFMGNGNGPYWDWKAGEFFECSGIGMGCTLVRVEALKDLKKPWFKTVYDYSRMLEYGIPALESWTEDLWFCQRIADTKKWKVFCDSSILCVHYDLNTGRGYTLPEDCKPLRKMEVDKDSKKILDIGSGIRPEGHYVCKEGKPIKCDFEYFNGSTDYRCDLTKLPFGTGEFDIVFSAALEMFSSLEVESVLNEWKRVVRPDGELRLIVSNAEEYIPRVLNNNLPLDSIYYMNGRYSKKNCFTKESIKKSLIEAGFDLEKLEYAPSDDLTIGVRARC